MNYGQLENREFIVNYCKHKLRFLAWLIWVMEVVVH